MEALPETFKSMLVSMHLNDADTWRYLFILALAKLAEKGEFLEVDLALRARVTGSGVIQTMIREDPPKLSFGWIAGSDHQEILGKLKDMARARGLPEDKMVAINIKDDDTTPPS